MAKPLVIVESPAKAKTIEGFLGRGQYTVKASNGHIRDLPRSAKEVPKSVTDQDVRRLGIDVNNHFEPVWVVPDKKKEYVKALKEAMKDASEVYLATDEDREGEAISWHVLEVLKTRRVPVKRMVFHEITQHAIEEAIENGRELDMKLVEAQRPPRPRSPLRLRDVARDPPPGRRRQLGRAGPERGRRASSSSASAPGWRSASASYWDLEGTFRAQATEFSATLVALDGQRLATGGLRGHDRAARRREPRSRCSTRRPRRRSPTGSRDAPFRVASVETQVETERPRAPFTTSTLQQEAGRKLDFSAARAMSIAQTLYENGYITYMRTDTTNLSEQAISAARDQIRDALRRGVPARRAPHVPRQGEERAGGARGDPPGGRRHAAPDELAHELHSERRASSLRADLEAHDRVPDGRCRACVASPQADATSTAGEQVDVQGDRPHDRVPGLPAGVRRGRRRSRRRARGP